MWDGQNRATGPMVISAYSLAVSTTRELVSSSSLCHIVYNTSIKLPIIILMTCFLVQVSANLHLRECLSHEDKERVVSCF